MLTRSFEGVCPFGGGGVGVGCLGGVGVGTTAGAAFPFSCFGNVATEGSVTSSSKDDGTELVSDARSSSATPF